MGATEQVAAQASIFIILSVSFSSMLATWFYGHSQTASHNIAAFHVQNRSRPPTLEVRTRTASHSPILGQYQQIVSAPALGNNPLVAEPEGSTPLIRKPVTARDPEPVPSTSHPHNLFP